MHEYWERQYGLDLKEPNVGVVNVTDADSVWVSTRLQQLAHLSNHDTLDGLTEHSRTNLRRT